MKAAHPEGIDTIVAAVHEIDRLGVVVSEREGAVQRKRDELAAVEAELTKAKDEHAGARAHLASLVATGACTTESCSYTHPKPNGQAKTNGASNAAHTNGVHTNGTTPKKTGPKYALNDESVPIVWRIGFMLLHDPVLDYQRTAEAIWGAGLEAYTAKNRVNAHVAQLRKLGVVESKGNNRFLVNRKALAEKSGLALPSEASS